MKAGAHPPKAQVRTKLGKERLCGSLLQTKHSVSSPGLWVQTRVLAPAGRAALETPAFNELPNQLARERRAPSLAQPASSPCPLRSSLPFSISLPFPPRQGAAQAQAGAGSPPARPTARRPSRRAEPQPKRGQGSGSPGRRGRGRRAQQARAGSGHRHPTERTASPRSTKAAGARAASATPSKWEAARRSAAAPGPLSLTLAHPPGGSRGWRCEWERAAPETDSRRGPAEARAGA